MRCDIVKKLVLLFCCASLVAVCGCATPKDDAGSPLPWSRPEPWEGKIPGVPSMN